MGVESYRYQLPRAVGESVHVDVLPVEAADPRLRSHAWAFQRLINVAWVEQFKGELASDEIAITADPRNADLVASQAERLGQERSDGQPVYARAEILKKSLSQLNPRLIPVIVGLGKSKFAGRSGEPRLADISDIYVDPGYQNNGIGTSVFRSLLDGYQPDQQLVAYEFAANVRTLETLSRLGYSSVKSWQVEEFGRQMDQVYLRGPFVGEMIEELEKRNPWLRGRQTLEKQDK